MTNLTPEPNASEAVVPEGVQKARAAFLRDFQALYADPKICGRFVIYHQDRRVEATRTYSSAIDEVNRLNLPDGEYLIIEVSLGSEQYERGLRMRPKSLNHAPPTDRMPFPNEPVKSSSAASGTRAANQIVLWVSLTLGRVKSANPTAFRSRHPGHGSHAQPLDPGASPVEGRVSSRGVGRRGRFPSVSSRFSSGKPTSGSTRTCEECVTNSRTARRISSRPKGESPCIRRETSRASQSWGFGLSRRTVSF